MAKLLRYDGSFGPRGGFWRSEGGRKWLRVSRPDDWTAPPEYWATWHAVVDRLLARGICTVAVEQGLLAGFVCWEPWESKIAVHYCYVRWMYRQLGVARGLLDTLPRGETVYTHRSRTLAKVPEGWQFSLRPLLSVGHREAA